jgi:hypothetical protein
MATETPAPDKVVTAARALLRAGRLEVVGPTPGGEWLLARCRGTVYHAVALARDLPGPPTGHCTCGRRGCAHLYALHLSLTTAVTPAPPTAPRPRPAVAADRLAAAQRNGLDLLQTLVGDLLRGGRWDAPGWSDVLERRARQLAAAFLPGAAAGVRRLLFLARHGDRAAADRHAAAVDVLAQLAAFADLGRRFLDGCLTVGEAAPWAATWLGLAVAPGQERADLRLLELAHERTRDEACQVHRAASHLIDLGSGELFTAATERPFRGGAGSEQPSYRDLVLVRTAVAHSGWPPLRLTWEPATERRQPLTPGYLEQALGHAAPIFAPALTAFRDAGRHPLAPGETLAWLRYKRIGWVEGQLVLEDDAGARLVAADREPGYSRTANLARAAGGAGRLGGGVLVRLWVPPGLVALRAEPLALVTTEGHWRLGV